MKNGYWLELLGCNSVSVSLCYIKKPIIIAHILFYVLPEVIMLNIIMKNASKHQFSVSYIFSLLFLTETEHFWLNRKHFININLY